MITKSGIDLTISKLKSWVSTTFLSKVGGTLTGILYTNRGGVVPCTKEASSKTIPTLINEVKESQGQFGSVSIETAYNGLPATWYNYLYIPHRIGTSAGDNSQYGSLFLSPMTNTGNTYLYLINYADGIIGTPTRFSGSKTS